MKGFDITIKNELLETKHFEAMGKAVWLYMFLIDKMTSIDENEIGTVSSGRPLSFEQDIHPTFPVTRQTYYSWVTTLEKYPYILTSRAPYGISFKVLKAHKVFGIKSDRHVNKIEQEKLTKVNNKSKQKLTSNYNNNNNNNSTSSVAKATSKSEEWEKTLSFIKDNEEKWSKDMFMVPTKEGLYDWRYLLNRGKTTPDKLFGAYYWKDKTRISDGTFNYAFKNKDRAWAVFRQEQRYAKELASILNINEFRTLMKHVDDLAYNDKTQVYDFEWKLSTVMKNIHK